MKPGDRVNQFDNICEVQSDKASVTITSRYDGLVKTLHFKVDDVALVGAALLDIEIDDDDASKATDVTDTARTEGRTVEDQPVLDKEVRTDETAEDRILGKVLATPAVRRIAMENDIRLKNVAATGKGGRVLKEDVMAHLRKVSADSNQSIKRDIPQTGMTGKTIEIKGYTRHMWKTMTQSLVSVVRIVNRVMRHRASFTCESIHICRVYRTSCIATSATWTKCCAIETR